MTTDLNSVSDRDFRNVKWGALLGDILTLKTSAFLRFRDSVDGMRYAIGLLIVVTLIAVSYTHLRAHETVLDLVCRLLLEKKKKYIV